jgi:hypothetical protein
MKEMNNDCITNICAFMRPLEAARLTKQTVRVPTKIVLTGEEQIAQFSGWCEKLDTKMLREVTFDVPAKVYRPNEEKFVIGRVPSSVKRLVVRDHHFSRLVVPDTVEELVIEISSECHLDLPVGIKRLTLGVNFMGSIRTFPEGLEELKVLNWGLPMFSASTPIRLSKIPNTVRMIEIGEDAPTLVTRWPANLEVLVLPENHRGVNAWLERAHAPIPDVDVIYKPTVRHLLQRFDADPWWEDEDPIPGELDAWEQDAWDDFEISREFD